MNRNLNRKPNILVIPKGVSLISQIKQRDKSITSGSGLYSLSIINLIFQEMFVQDFFKTYYLVKKRKEKELEIFSIKNLELLEVNYLILIQTVKIKDESNFSNTFSIPINAWLLISLNENK
jgi:hypothetical protein